MIRQDGRIIKKTYCSNCFKIITWDNINDEQDSMGHRTIICPNCGFRENINDQVTLVEEGTGGGTPVSPSSSISSEYLNKINYLPTNDMLTIDRYIKP